MVEELDPLAFVGFPKIPRWSRDCIVTEKLDGTNGCIYNVPYENSDPMGFLVGSRKRWITPENDNHGFARWAFDHREELQQLGPGRHFGEWWGQGIQRGYGLKEKRFSIFNVSRWCLSGQEPKLIPQNDPRVIKHQDILPACVGLVPILWRGPFDFIPIDQILSQLETHGSSAAPGYMFPEGIVIFHEQGHSLFKKTLKNDEIPKSKGGVEE